MSLRGLLRLSVAVIVMFTLPAVRGVNEIDGSLHDPNEKVPGVLETIAGLDEVAEKLHEIPSPSVVSVSYTHLTLPTNREV